MRYSTGLRIDSEQLRKIITGLNSSTKITQMETQSSKRIKKKTNSRTEHTSFEGQYKMVTDICIPGRKRGQNEIEEIFEEVMLEKFPKHNRYKPLVQEVPGTLSGINYPFFSKKKTTQLYHNYKQTDEN